MTAFMCILLYHRIKYYMAYPISQTSHIVYHQRLKFPAVTICNQNLFRATHLLDKFVANDLELTNNRTPILYEVLPRLFHDASLVNQSFFNKYNATTLGDLDVVSILRKYGHQRSDLITKCTFNGVACNDGGYFTAHLTYAGLCFTFNADMTNVLNSTVYDRQDGLELHLNYEPHQYIHALSAQIGAILLVHDQSELPSQMTRQGTYIPSGARVSIGVKAIKRTFVDTANGDCVSENSVSHFMPASACSHSVCQLNRALERVHRQCGCILFDLSRPDTSTHNETSVCSVSQLLACSYPIHDILGFVEDNTPHCTCPIRCQSVSYQTFVSHSMTSQFHTKFRMGKRVNNPDTTKLSEYQLASLTEDWAFLLNSDPTILDKIHSIVYRLPSTYNMVSDIRAQLRIIMVRLVSLNVPDYFGTIIISIHSLLNAQQPSLKFNHSAFDSVSHVALDVKCSIILAHSILRFKLYEDIFMSDLASSFTWFASQIDQITIQINNRSLSVKSAEFDRVLTMSEEVTRMAASGVTALESLGTEYDLLRHRVNAIYGRMYESCAVTSPCGIINSEGSGVINVYFQDMGVMEIEDRSTYDVWALICDVGAILALCLGASLLTLMEIIDILMFRWRCCAY